MRKWLSETVEALRKNWESLPKYWFYIVLSLGSAIVGGTIVVFILGIALQPRDKYDVFVTLLIIILSLIGVMGYGVYRWEESKLESRLHEMVSKLDSGLNERLQKEEQRIQNGQTLFLASLERHVGYIFWELYGVERKKSYPSKIMSKELIELAITHSEISLGYAMKLPENEYKIDIDRCKNNWVYLKAEAALIKDFVLTKNDKEKVLKIANEILEEVSKQDYPDTYYRLKESSAWGLQHLSEEEDTVSKQKAIDIFHELLNDENIPYPWREKIGKKWVARGIT